MIKWDISSESLPNKFIHKGKYWNLESSRILELVDWSVLAAAASLLQYKGQAVTGYPQLPRESTPVTAPSSN